MSSAGTQRLARYHLQSNVQDIPLMVACPYIVFTSSHVQSTGLRVGVNVIVPRA
jgi:hypothetical protein